MRIASIIGLTTAALAAHCVADVRGQELPLKTDLPPLPSNACEARGYVFQAESAPPAEAAAEAQRLTAEANQAAILGDVQRARSLLGEAAALDRTSSAISYVFGRQLEAGGEHEAALSEYCRFLGIDPDAAEVDDVEARIERIGTEVGALGAGPGRTALEDGIRTFELGDFDEAVLDFSRALVERPDWDQAHFNRAVAYLSSGRDAAGVADLEFYLEVAPDAEDRAEIEALLDEIGPLAEYSPSTALVSGLFIPGMGHFYTGRPGMGVLVLGAAATSAGFAVLHREIQISCQVPPIDGACPPGEGFSPTEQRPLLVPGLVAAAAITVLGAIHASRGARQDAIQLSDGGGLEGSLPMLFMRGSEPTLRVEPAYDHAGRGLRAELEVRF